MSVTCRLSSDLVLPACFYCKGNKVAKVTLNFNFFKELGCCHSFFTGFFPDDYCSVGIFTVFRNINKVFVEFFLFFVFSLGNSKVFLSYGMGFNVFRKPFCSFKAL